MDSSGNISLVGHSLNMAIPQAASIYMNSDGISINGNSFAGYFNNSGIIMDTFGNIGIGGAGEFNIQNLIMTSSGNTLGDMRTSSTGGSFTNLITTNLTVGNILFDNFVISSDTTGNNIINSSSYQCGFFQTTNQIIAT